MALKKRRTEEIAKKKEYKSGQEWFEDSVRAMMSAKLLSSVGISSHSLSGLNSSSLNNQRKTNMKLYGGTGGGSGDFATQGDAGDSNTNNSVTGISLDSLSKIEYKSSADPYSRVGIRDQIEDSNKIHYHNLGGMWMKDPSMSLLSAYPVVHQDDYKIKDTCEKRKEPWSEK
tara:strand:- start:16790 stop:17305 length:516 start_codon:yes stop_codon:yes gene_type:complete